jgi:hypothetical protein
MLHVAGRAYLCASRAFHHHHHHQSHPPSTMASEAAIRLAKLTNSPSLWKKIEQHYHEMLVSKGGKDLKKLDRCLEAIEMSLLRRSDEASNDTPVLIKKELIQVIQWKFSIGKWRPLMKYIEQNSESDVEKISSSSFGKAQQGDIEAAVSEMSRLKGVGPASASASLSMYRPDLFVFMADEVIDSLYNGKRDYTLPIYLKVNDKCIEIANQLGDDWTARRVGRALWTAARICATGGNDLTLVERESQVKRSSEGRLTASRAKRQRKKA